MWIELVEVEAGFFLYSFYEIYFWATSVKLSFGNRVVLFSSFTKIERFQVKILKIAEILKIFIPRQILSENYL